MRVRDLAMFALVAAAVAAAVVLIGRELDVGQQATATREGVTTNSEPSASSQTSVAQEQAATEPEAASSDLTLTLTAPATCDVESYTYAVPGRVRSPQDDGSTRWVWKNLGYGGVAEFELQWSVDGGTGPYTLEIDGESRDARRDYAGRVGTASLGCLVDPGETLIHTPAAGWGDPPERLYRKDPEPSIDSGLKTIRATVTDATGATADASVDVYVILAVNGSGDLMQAGKTYRVFGLLVTIPEGVDAEVGVVDQPEGGESAVHIPFRREGYRAWVVIGLNTGKELNRVVQRLTGNEAQGASGEFAEAIEARLHAQMDALVKSVGQIPAGGSE